MFLALIFILGSCIGSFLNVVIYRLPIMLKNEEYNEALDFLEDSSPRVTKRFNLSYPGSHCPQCKNNIPFWANIPIIGYFTTKTRCYHCHIHIPLRYPLVEFVTATMFLAISYLQPNLLILGFNLVFISIIICCILISYDGNPIPNSLTLTLLWLGILINTKINLAPILTISVIGAILGYLLIKIFLLILAVIKNTSSTEHSAAILAAAMGGWFGYIAMLQLLAPAIILFLCYNFVFSKFKKLNLSVLIGLFGIIYLFSTYTS